MDDSQTKKEHSDPSPAGASLDNSREGSGQSPLADIPWDDWTMMNSTGTTFDQDQFIRDTMGLNDFYFEGGGEGGEGFLDQAGDFTNVLLWLDGAYQPLVPCGYCRQN